MDVASSTEIMRKTLSISITALVYAYSCCSCGSMRVRARTTEDDSKH